MNTVRNTTPEANQNTIDSKHGQEETDSRLRHDASARALAARHARFDPDARMFVMAFGAQNGCVALALPENWGFERTPRGYQWTARGLFDLTAFPPAPPSRSTLTRPRFHDIFDDMTTEQWGNRIGGNRADPFHCVPQLRQLRIIAELRNVRELLDESICFALAVALGNCRLFGVRLADGDDFTLSPSAAILAARQAIVLSRAEEQATERSPIDAADRLQVRMDLWAASLVLEESLEATSAESAPDTIELDGILKALRRGVGRIDANLQRQIPLLRPAAGTHLLENWRRLLAPAHRDTPPWWLDGCLG
jgi:hypothetical protein